jgi:hypothetical protein
MEERLVLRRQQTTTNVTSMVSLTVPLAVMVRSAPRTGGSGERLMDLSSTRSVGSPKDCYEAAMNRRAKDVD